MTETRDAPLNVSADEFRRLAYRVVDRIADHIAHIHELPVGRNEAVTTTRDLLGSVPIPESSSSPEAALEQAMDLLFEHSTLTAHPRFWAFITGSASPLGAIGDLLAAALNPNVASWNTAGAASAFEAQAVRWCGDLLHLGPEWGGLLVSGGTAANLLPFFAARRWRAGWDVRREGTRIEGSPQLRVYASREAHPWLGRASDLSGLGLGAIHWVDTDSTMRMNPDALERAIREDRAAGDRPLMVVGTAGSVSLGVVDPLEAIAAICRREDVWFHVDGAYGGFAACSPEAPSELRALSLADSVAVDPHKWLYVPLEAGCVLMKDPALLGKTFAYDESLFQYNTAAQGVPPPYREQGLQNSRGFRALKLWLCLRAAGRRGYEQMISDDIRLARRLYERVGEVPDLEALSTSLSTTVFRYVPSDLRNVPDASGYLDKLNTELQIRLQLDGYAYPSLAKVRGSIGLRVCIVNFRTTWPDLEGLVSWCVQHAPSLDQELRSR